LSIKTTDEGAKFIIIAGEPLNETTVQYGPFVVGSQEELQKTFEDYQKGKNGFEGAREFVSKIRELSDKKNKK